MRARMIPVLLAALLLAGCQRGATLDVELLTTAAVADGQLLAEPQAIELLDAANRLHRLPLRPVQPLALGVSATPQRLPAGRLPPGRYLGLRLRFASPVWWQAADGARMPLLVDAQGPFEDIDLVLQAGEHRRLQIVLDLPGSLPFDAPFHERHRFVPQLAWQ